MVTFHDAAASGYCIVVSEAWRGRVRRKGVTKSMQIWNGL